MQTNKHKGYVSKFLHQVIDAAAVLASPSIVAHQQPTLCKVHGTAGCTEAIHLPNLTAQQLQVLMNAAVGAASDNSPAEVFHRIEVLLQELLGITSVRLLYVSQWHQKLFEYAKPDAVTCRQGKSGQAGKADESTAAWALTLQQRFFCKVGEGIVGAVARSGQPVCVADCGVVSKVANHSQGSMVSF
jgi:hypothetical protein